MTERWYDSTPQQLENKLGSDLRFGLSQKNAVKRLRRRGENQIFPLPKGPFRLYIKHVLTDFTSILLIFTALLSAVYEQSTSAVVIVVLLLMNCAAAIFVYVKAHRVLESMNYYGLPSAKAMRDGRLYMIRQEMLVPGDIIFLTAGDIVPADARLLESEKLTVLETNLTGEQHSVPKDPDFLECRDILPAQQKNMLFAATIVTAGTAKAIVCAVGEDTQICKTGRNVDIMPHEQLTVLGTLKKYCETWSLCMIAFVFCLTAADCFLHIADRSLFNVFLTGLTLAVASMSELYTAFGYITVACGIFGAVKRHKDINCGVIVKNAKKLEDMKDLTCLIFPKAAAFSVRDSRVERVYIDGSQFSRGERGYARSANRLLRYAVISTGIYGGRKLVVNNITNNNIYSPEEDAILSAAEDCGVYNSNLDRNYPILEHASVSNDNRFETTLAAFSGGYFVTIRGDAPSVLNECRYYCEGGRVLPLTGAKLNELLSAANSMAKEALRVIAVATRSTANTNLIRLRACQSDMTFEGFLAIREPLLPLAAKNIARCRKYGIRTIMLCDEESENNLRMAEALGIVSGEEEAMSGRAFSRLKEGLFRADIKRYGLYQGLTPHQKQRLLRALRDSGEKVGFAGRTLDEIDLLKEADVSFSQNITISRKAVNGGIDLTGRNVPVFVRDARAGQKNGCEAVKFLSDAIISEPDRNGSGGLNAMLSSISVAKVIYQNLLRVVRYLVTSQTAKFLIVMWSVFTRAEILTPVQVLFGGLLIDFAAVLILAFEPPAYDTIAAKVKTEAYLQRPILYSIPDVLLGAVWAAAVVVLPRILDYYNILSTAAQYGAMLFCGFVLSQLMVLAEVKREKSIFAPGIVFNYVHGLVLLMAAAFFAVCFAIPSFGGLFGIVRMPWKTALAAFVLPLIMMAVYELYKGASLLVMRLVNTVQRKRRDKVHASEGKDGLFTDEEDAPVSQSDDNVNATAIREEEEAVSSSEKDAEPAVSLEEALDGDTLTMLPSEFTNLMKQNTVHLGTGGAVDWYDEFFDDIAAAEKTEADENNQEERNLQS